eukprot:4853503-Amphidinium_carterae.3
MQQFVHVVWSCLQHCDKRHTLQGTIFKDLFETDRANARKEGFIAAQLHSCETPMDSKLQTPAQNR